MNQHEIYVFFVVWQKRSLTSNRFFKSNSIFLANYVFLLVMHLLMIFYSWIYEYIYFQFPFIKALDGEYWTQKKSNLVESFCRSACTYSLTIHFYKFKWYDDYKNISTKQKWIFRLSYVIYRYYISYHQIDGSFL